MFSTIISGALQGVSSYLVQVEVDVSTGLPGFCMVGSLSGEVREARERVQVALKNSGLEIPPMKITVNLAPANLHKEGTAFDLPIAVGVLEAIGILRGKAAEDILFVGELGLDGEIKPVRGVLPIVREAANRGVKQCVVPRENVTEGAVIPGVKVRGAGNIKELLCFLKGGEEERETLLPACRVDPEKLFEAVPDERAEDFSEIKGQEAARRAAEIAAAGFHNLLLIGPPGAGKSMIARRIPGILPPLTLEESLEVSSVYSVAGLLRETQSLIVARPFQNPHHTISQSALTGGGVIPRPGIISLSHRGVLFLDELPEFGRRTLDCMRQPIEEREVHISRAQGHITYPADFMFVCAMNPCVCGFYPDRNRCACTEAQVRRYTGRVSGPILDRMDLCVEVLPVEIGQLENGAAGESSAQIRERVQGARRMQEERFRGSGCRTNADMGAGEVRRFCPLERGEQKMAEELFAAMKLSARGYHRLLKVARTIADLEGKERIGGEHLAEAACYRITDNNCRRNREG